MSNQNKRKITKKTITKEEYWEDNKATQNKKIYVNKPFQSDNPLKPKKTE